MLHFSIVWKYSPAVDAAIEDGSFRPWLPP
eukprot:SAG31_NODE_12371_length_946_cov_2.049587_2_plen_29_part_01